MAQETAVMQLINFILVERRQEDGSIKFHAHDDFSIFLQMEKKQIIDAHGKKINGGFRSNGDFFHEEITGEQYYKETYGEKSI